ncbi:hypothetical protein HTZ77_11465 [Nonomuraea sp. SMC257]|uniref:Uncharacterized protein n=1 Tax=Nonomuraea montanisoli TaxID=2741721 RepID=A0A7Y6M3A6_9ACTN|nr:hypothetical protein [Nonomuraea montanisoli]NUW32044.1 hypothetical protein [Nonomuraea montanisoli]
MPKKTSDGPHSYDADTDTVRVSRTDLWRLLLTFRNLAPGHGQGSWSHMEDHDISFECLADAIDAANQVLNGRTWTGPDYRMRCDLSQAYRWPQHAPYDGGLVTAVRVVDAASGTDRGSHYVPAPRLESWPTTLCGFGFTPQEARPVDGDPDCTACLREPALVEHLQATTGGEPRTTPAARTR